MLSNKKRNDEKPPGSPAWMTTFGDMMTLLLVFFVFLYSFSVMDLNKFESFITALKSSLGVLQGGQTIVDESEMARGSIGENFNPSQRVFNKIIGEMSNFIRERGLEQEIVLEQNERGLVVRLTGQILYDLGKADIKPEGREILDQVAVSIRNIENNIMVEGHTDNWPINTEQFPSNWELSTARATNVIRYFIEEHQITADRLAAAGYSEYRPLYSNDTRENRAGNRRVEIVILRQG
ncbi:MAG TPA: OmpA family protein [Halanaerobiales bacterium]|nr:OmpA family protein [Halanaerobiales bacterium]